jgi:hypothetical protein
MEEKSLENYYAGILLEKRLIDTRLTFTARLDTQNVQNVCAVLGF